MYFFDVYHLDVSFKKSAQKNKLKNFLKFRRNDTRRKYTRRSKNIPIYDIKIF
jgi:hypothetical protein